MADTAIEWTHRPDTIGAVWNPCTGCDKKSPGCDNCYACVMAKRLKGMGQAKYQTDGDPRTSGLGFGVAIHPDALPIPLRWRKPRTVFVNSMSDLFHARVPREFVAEVFAVMALTPQHTYQVLTKRPERMPRMLDDPGFRDQVWVAACKRAGAGDYAVGYSRILGGLGLPWAGPSVWPLPNVWLGTSIESQKYADERIPWLLDTPAAVRWLSCEPLLGPVDLTRVQLIPPAPPHGPGVHLDALRGHAIEPDDVLPNRVDWVVCGGESGPGARPMDEEWVRSLVRQCAEAGVPAFVKQLGTAWAHEHGGPKKGGDPAFWPADLRVREYPEVRAAVEAVQ